MADRREFLKSLLASTVTIPHARKIVSWFDGEALGHLQEFDDNDAPMSTLQRAFITVTHGNVHPTIILSSSRPMGRMWNALKPTQQFAVRDPWFGEGFMFLGASWFESKKSGDKIELCGPTRTPWGTTHGTWGWYRASLLILRDPYGDVCYRAMRQKMEAIYG